MILKDELRELAERVEAATPDIGASLALVELEDEVKRAVWKRAHIAPQPFLHSLDAAMQLVPEGWASRIEDWPRPDEQTDIASDGGPNAKAVLMECHRKRIGKQNVWGFHTPGSQSFEVRAATPALALTAAALRARALPTQPGVK